MARKTKRPRPVLNFEQLEHRDLLATDFSLIKDATPYADYASGSLHTVVGNRIFYVHNDSGRSGLWVTDGTPDGTLFLRESTSIERIVPVNNTAYFTSFDALWKSDGTVNGTVAITVGCCESVSNTKIAAVNGKLLMTHFDSTSGKELWVTSPDTTQATLLKDIIPGSFSSYPGYFTDVNGTIYFTADSNPEGRELWKTDGTAAGTVLVKDIAVNDSKPQNLTNVNGTLYFTANTTATGRELWKSDGTAAGTILVVDATPGPLDGGIRKIAHAGTQVYFEASTVLWKLNASGTGGATQVTSIGSNINEAVGVNGLLYFNTMNADLWRSDGSASGTFKIGNRNAADLFGFNNLLYFRDSSNNGFWKSDGTAAGTVTFEPATTADPLRLRQPLFLFNGQLAMGAFRRSDGGIWLSDGTPAGTQLFTRLYVYNSAHEKGNIYGLTVINDVGYFTKGEDFWRTDGSYEGTYLLQPSLSIVSPVDAPASVSLNNRILFAARVPGEGLQLWSTDGTPSGTTVVKKFGTTSTTSLIGPLTQLGNQLMFLVSIDRNLSLWKTDGTDAGTQMIKALPNESFDFNSINWEMVGNWLTFTTKSTSGHTLWKSDGTLSGTTSLGLFATANFGNHLTEWNGLLYFFADNASGMSGLWRANLSDNSLEHIHGLSTGSPKSVLDMLVVNNQLFILDATALWRSDGTTPGTIQLTTIQNAQSLVSYRDKLYFMHVPVGNQHTLWVSDGTVAGTLALKNLPRTSSSPTLYPIGNDLYIEARSIVYKSDGTSAGTLPMARPTFTPLNLFEFEFDRAIGLIAGHVVFAGIDSEHGAELFTYATTDYGDAPFATGIIDRGAAHIAVGPRLGTKLDTDEVNGQTSLAADGDDKLNTDDEDGLATLPSLNVGELSNFDFFVSGATAKTKLYGWFDWNLDGDWNDAGERMIDGASVVNGTNRISLTVPNSASNGTVVARFRIGDQAAMGPLGLATSGEVEDYVFKMGEDMLVDLNGTSNNIIIRKSADRIQAVDAATNQVLTSQVLSRLIGLKVTGSASNADLVKIDYASGGFFAIPGGILFDGLGGIDSVSIVGTNTTRLSQGLLPAPSGMSELLTSEGSASGFVRFTNVENLGFSGFQSFALSGAFDIGSRSISIGSATPVDLGSTTSINGGTLTADAIHLSSGDTLVGSGRVAARVSLDSGSNLRLTGDMQIGDASSNSGFTSQGILETGTSRLTLLDADTIELSGQTKLGSVSGDGVLRAANGLTLASAALLTGRGTVDTPNSVTLPLINRGSIEGLSSAETIVLPGYTIGSGKMNWTRVTGTYDPGPSPGTSAITHGSVTYAGKLLLYANGATPGTQYDQLNHTGAATLGGELNVQFLDGYMLDFNSTLALISGTQGVGGTFSTLNLPSAPNGAPISGVYSASTFSLSRAQLRLTIGSSTFSEQGGSTTGTVTRTGSDLTQAVVVQLTNGDPSELSIPSSVTIGVGRSSVGFTITAVDDALLDGDQRVTIAATAASIGTVEQSITVTDREALLLTLDASSISELGGKAIATVTRENTDRDLPLEVQVTSSKPGQTTVPLTVTIAAGQGSATFDIDAVDDTLLDGTQTVAFSVAATGYDPAQKTLDVLDSEQITLQLNRSTISEKSDSTILTVTRSNTDIDSPLTVQLQGSDSSELTVPASVVIPASQSSATLTLDSVDDSLLDGDQSIDIRAKATGYADGLTTLVVQDYEALAITIFSNSMSEKGGSISGRVTRNVSDLSRPLPVTFTFSDATQATIDTTITIAAQLNFAPFTIMAKDNAMLDGTRDVRVSADANGFISAVADFNVIDSENLTLSLSATSVSEGAGETQATITRSNTDTEQPLIVTLSASNSGHATVPPTVTIEAGKSSAAFPVTIINNDLLDGPRSISISAQSAGYIGSSANLQITDNERLTINLLAQQTTEGVATIQGSVLRSTTNNSSPLVVALLSDNTGEATVPAQVTIPANQASTSFVITIKDDSLLDGSKMVNLTAIANGYLAGTALLTVLDNESLSVTIDKSTISELGGAATATVTRNNTDRNQPLVVDLSTDVFSQLTIPASVTIPANAASATFAISAIDNSILDGTRTVTIQADSTGYVPGDTKLNISDSESLSITIDTPIVPETAGTVSGVISRSNTNVDQPLVVSLSSSVTSKATVPAVVTILQGETQVPFTITIVNDTVFSVNTIINLTATSNGYIGGEQSLSITDDDRQFPWQNPRKSLDVNDDRLVTAIDALLIINALNTRFQLTPQLPDPFFPAEYLDVNGDNSLSAIDALLVINALNNPGQAEGEFEFEATIDLVAEDVRKNRLGNAFLVHHGF